MITYATRALPPALGASLAETRGLSRIPSTLGELTAGLDLASVLSPGASSIDPAALCSSAPSAHEIESEGQSRFTNCALDALMLPFIEKVSGLVRSTSPVSGTIVELDLRGDDLQ